MKKGFAIIFLTSIILILSSTSVKAQEGYNNIEIFDVQAEHVIKTVPWNPMIQDEIVSYLKSITGLYAKFNPVPEKGFAVKVFLDPVVKVENGIMNSFVDEVIVMFPSDDSPFLLAFENESNLICFTFEGDTNKLLKLLDYEHTTSG